MNFYDIYKHVNNTDVVMMPVSITYATCGLQIKCLWFRIVYDGGYVYLGDDTIFVRKKDLTRWIKVHGSNNQK